MTRKTALATAVRMAPLVFGLALLACVAMRLGVHDILRMLVDMRWSLFPVLLLYTGHEMSRATALKWCVRGRNALTSVEAFLIRLSGEAVECLTFTGPMLSEPTKAWLLQRSGLELSEGLSATLTEYLASMVAGAVTAVIGVSYVLLVLRPVGPVRVAAIVILSSMSVFLVFMTIAAATRIRMASVLINVIIRRTIPGVVAIEDALIRTTRETPRRFLAIMSAEFAAQGFLGLELWALLVSLHLPCPLARAALMEGVMKFMNAGTFVPGQAGVAEGSYAVIFTVFGLPAAAGVTLSFARRVRTLATALVGVAALIALRRSPKSKSWRIPRAHAADNAQRSADAAAVTSRRPPVLSSVR
jgi:glycosyltransferase 2 family protein